MRSKDGEGSARLRQAEAFPQCRAFAESGAAPALSRYDPSRENGIAERPQALRYSEIINILSAIYAQSNAERILNRPAHGAVQPYLCAIARRMRLAMYLCPLTVGWASVAVMAKGMGT